MRFPPVVAFLLAAATILLTARSGPGLSAATEEGELPVLVRSFQEVDEPAAPFSGGKFEPRQGETIAFLGGTNTLEQDRHGFLEIRFQVAWPGRNLKLRNLAWQGDVLTHQARPRNFYTKTGDPQPGSVPDLRERTEAGTIFVAFGKMESLPGGDWSVKAYRDLIAALGTRTRRLVLVAPTPFFPVGPASSQAEARNEKLAIVTGEIAAVAKENEALFVDLFTPFRKTLDPAYSTNGIHLTEAGHRAVADEIAHQLEFPEAPKAEAAPELSQSLRQAIARKNGLWQQYYRPTNWAFLFGDRQHVPASRDPVERSERWFLREIEALPPLIREAEADIHRYAAGIVGKISPKP